MATNFIICNQSKNTANTASIRNFIQAPNVPLASIAARTIGYEDMAEINALEAAGIPYYLTIASSDFTTMSPAKPVTLSDSFLTTFRSTPRPLWRGYYVHEYATYLASTNGWSWPTAVGIISSNWIKTRIDEMYINQLRMVWSEPAQGWLNLKYKVKSAGRNQANYVAAMFATNFVSPSSGGDQNLTDAKQGVVNWMAQSEPGLNFWFPGGESVQGWYFYDKKDPPSVPQYPGGVPTVQGVVDLCGLGKAIQVAAAPFYYQIEGQYNDMMVPNSQFLQGVKAFTASI